MVGNDQPLPSSEEEAKQMFVEMLKQIQMNNLI